MRWPWGRHREQDLDRELRSHLEAEEVDQQEAGRTAEEARAAARRAFGNVTLVKEDVREMWGWTAVEQMALDIRYALRMMRKDSGFTLVALLSLGLGIGATTSVFRVLNAVVLRPLPVPEADRLVIVQPERRGERYVFFNPVFESVRERQQSLSGMFAISDEPYLKVSVGGAAPAFLRGSLVSGNYFQTLGLVPALGRLFTSDDDEADAAMCTAVVSHTYWTANLRGDLSVIGTPLVARDKPCTIVGVAPQGFAGHQVGYAPDLWLPLRPMTSARMLAHRTLGFFSGVMGRLRPGVTREQAAAELTAIYRQIQAGEPLAPPGKQASVAPADFRVAALSGAQGLDAARRRFNRPLWLIMAVAGVVLLIAIANVANLLLARGSARQAEFATRAALGAGRSRLIRQITIEGAMLALLGGALGVLLASLATPLVAAQVFPSSRPMRLDATLDWRVVAVACGVTLLTALLSGVIPALRLTASSLQSQIAGAGRTAGTRSGQRGTRALVAAQLALSLLLVASASLLLRSLWRIMAVDPGFDAASVILMDVRDTEPAREGGDDSQEALARRANLYHDLDSRLNAIPGVRSGAVSWLGLFGGNYVGVAVHDVERPDDARFTLTDYVTPRYFETTGMRLVHGRGILESDREGTERVAVVNQAFVRDRLPGGREPIGQRFVMTYGTDKRPFTIAGVVRDSRYNDLRETKTDPMMWVALSQVPVRIRSISLRVQPGSEASVRREAQAALTAASPHLMAQRHTTLRSQVDQATARERLLLSLTGSFGTLALLLAAVGVYGTLAYSVARRTREIGVRMALGARPALVVRMVVSESIAMVAVGLLAGIPLALGAGRLLRSFLFGVEPHDAAAMIGAGIALLAVTVAAALVPARRASRVDPVTALRSE